MNYCTHRQSVSFFSPQCVITVPSESIVDVSAMPTKLRVACIRERVFARPCAVSSASTGATMSADTYELACALMFHRDEIGETPIGTVRVPADVATAEVYAITCVQYACSYIRDNLSGIVVDTRAPDGTQLSLATIIRDIGNIVAPLVLLGRSSA